MGKNTLRRIRQNMVIWIQTKHLLIPSFMISRYLLESMISYSLFLCMCISFNAEFFSLFFFVATQVKYIISHFVDVDLNEVDSTSEALIQFNTIHQL